MKLSLAEQRIRVLFFGALLLVALFVSLRDFYAYQFGYNPDAVDYILLTRALIHGPAFGLAYTPTAPEPTQYPFGFPLLLVPFQLLAPSDYALPQWLSLGATLLSGAILFWGWRALVPGYSERWRYAVTAMFLLAPMTIVNTRVVLSEAVFTSFVLLTFFFAALVLRMPQRRVLWLAFGVAFFFMVFTRSIGWVIGLSIIVYLGWVLRRAMLRGAFIALLVMGVMVGAVLVMTPVTVSDLVPQQYTAWFFEFGPFELFLGPRESRFSRDSDETAEPLPSDQVIQAGTLGQTVTPDDLPQYVFSVHVHEDLRRVLSLTGGGDREAALLRQLNLPWLPALPGIVALSLLILGNMRWAYDAFTRGHKRLELFQIAVLPYLVVVFMWRGGGERLFYPVQPQLYIALLLALWTLIQTSLWLGARVFDALRHERGARAARLAMGGIVAAWLALALWRDSTLSNSYAMWGDLTQRSQAIAAYTPPDALLFSDWPSLDYVLTGRKSVLSPPRNRMPTNWHEWLVAQDVRYVILPTDQTLQVIGISPARQHLEKNIAAFRDMITRGELVHVYSSPFPITILRVVNKK